MATHPPVHPDMTTAEFLALPVVDLERQVIEEHQRTPDGYLLTQAVLPGEVFRPKLFPDLTINLRSPLREAEEPAPSLPKRRRSRR